MDTTSKSNKVYTDDDEDEEIFLRRDGSAQKDLAVRADGKGSGDQKQPTTPKSKHSATEQRRRSKINDRFQILRDLIPHSDQKRDKASFLLEVIEYIQFLHEKVQKYESGYPGWNQDTTKLMPWVKVFFRSLWKKSRKNSQLPVDGLADPSHVIQNGLSSGGFVFAGDNTAPLISTNDPTTLDSENVNSGLLNKASTVSSPLQSYGSGSGNVQTQQRLFSGSENIASQSQWLGQCSVSGGNMLNEHELAIDEGTINISSAYSQGLLHAITQALHNSGIDLSQASISVQINLGKRALGRPVSNPKDNDANQAGNEASHLQMGGNGEELEQANKRHKLDKS